MKKYYLDKNIKFILIVSINVISICIIIAIKYVMYKLRCVFNYPEWVTQVMMFLLITTYAIATFIILPMWFRSVCYIVTSDALILRAGVFGEKTTYIKFSSIQYISIKRCRVKLGKMFNKLLIDVYGRNHKIVGLSSSELEEIYKTVQIKINGTGGS